MTSKIYKTKRLSSGEIQVTYFMGHNEKPETYIYGCYGGYIYDVTDKPGTLGQQVCDRMYHTGSTLTATDESFHRVLKRHLRLYAYDTNKEIEEGYC